MWVMMVQHKTSDQYLTPSKVSTRSEIQAFKNLKHFEHANADADADAEANAMVVLHQMLQLTN